MKESQIREYNFCKNKYPDYLHYLTENLNASRMKQYIRLFKYDITPEIDPEIFEKINNMSAKDMSYMITDYIRDIRHKKYYQDFINKLSKSNIPLPKEKFTINDFDNIEIYSISEIKSPENKSKYPDYIHVELDILTGNLDDKINFAKKFKELIKFKVYYKLNKKYGFLINFLTLYEYKFYSKKTVGDHGIVKGLLRFESKTSIPLN